MLLPWLRPSFNFENEHAVVELSFPDRHTFVSLINYARLVVEHMSNMEPVVNSKLK
jgi:hypothetical protein